MCGDQGSVHAQGAHIGEVKQVNVGANDGGIHMPVTAGQGPVNVYVNPAAPGDEKRRREDGRRSTLFLSIGSAALLAVTLFMLLQFGGPLRAWLGGPVSPGSGGGLVPPPSDAQTAMVTLIRDDPSLTMEQKRVQMSELLNLLMAQKPISSAGTPLSEESRQAVEATFADASPVQRYAAQVRAGLYSEADSLVDQIERTVATLSQQERYEYFTARGDRHWVYSEYTAASPWYAQAMSIRADDPWTVDRAATCQTLRGDAGSYAQGLQNAEAWLRSCLQSLDARAGDRAIERARLLATLSKNLLYQGRLGECAEPAREAVRLLANAPETPGVQVHYIWIDAAVGLDCGGARSEASAAADRAMSLTIAAGGAESGDRAYVASWRAGIRRNAGDLSGAESDIDLAIAWDASRNPPSADALGFDYAVRAGIRNARSDLTGALADMDLSIAWTESVRPINQSDLSVRLARRAQIQLDAGNPEGALRDIGRSIAWSESQPYRNETDLATWRAQRAVARRDLNDLPGAEQDITRALAWAELQPSGQESSLAAWRGRRADIRHLRSDLLGAAVDIAAAIQWGESRMAEQERSLAVWYSTRARIFRDQGHLADAMANIEWSLTWWQGRWPDDKTSLDYYREIKASIEDAAKKSEPGGK